MTATDVTLKANESIIFRSDVVAIGAFRCPATHPLFRDSGSCSSHTFVFPRTATSICHEGGRPFVAAPGTVTCYNQHQAYTRDPLSASDDSDWYVVADDILRDAIALFDPGVSDRPQRPFTFAATTVDAKTFLDQRLLFETRATTRSRPRKACCRFSTVFFVRPYGAEERAAPRVPLHARVPDDVRYAAVVDAQDRDSEAKRRVASVCACTRFCSSSFSPQLTRRRRRRSGSSSRRRGTRPAIIAAR